MLTVNQLLNEADLAFSRYRYYKKCDTLSYGRKHIKFPLIIERGLFVQVNRNETASITNFALIHEGERIFGRDEYKGSWHRHPLSCPDRHNQSAEGRRSVTLTEFLAEVNEALRNKGMV